MNRILATSLSLCLGFSLFVRSPLSHAQTNTDPNQSVNRTGAKPQTKDTTQGSSEAINPLPQFSGNLPATVNEDRTHGVNAPGTLIGPSPESGQPDPRFPTDKGTSGGGSEINQKSSSHSTSQAPVPAEKMPGEGQLGGTTSSLNEGLPSASKDNSGANSGTGSGGPGGEGGNPGGDARPDQGASRSTNDVSNVGQETAGAAPFAIGAGAVIIGGFLGAMMWARAKKRR